MPREQVRKKRVETWKKKACILHQNNVPAHNALRVKQFSANKCIRAPGGSESKNYNEQGKSTIKRF
jgi:hypothetical protein